MLKASYLAYRIRQFFSHVRTETMAKPVSGLIFDRTDKWGGELRDRLAREKCQSTLC